MVREKVGRDKMLWSLGQEKKVRRTGRKKGRKCKTTRKPHKRQEQKGLAALIKNSNIATPPHLSLTHTHTHTLQTWRHHSTADFADVNAPLQTQRERLSQLHQRVPPSSKKLRRGGGTILPTQRNQKWRRQPCVLVKKSKRVRIYVKKKIENSKKNYVGSLNKL